MRIVKVGVLAPTNKGIPLGVQGENIATEVEFDTRPWFREYPSGTVSAVARRDGDKAPYPLSLDVADGTAVWQVSDTDTAKAGEGAVELTMTSAGSRVRSLTFNTLVTASLTDAPVDDDAWYGWLDKAVVKVDETVQAAQRKMAEVDEEWTGLKSDVTAKVDECGKAASQAAEDAHHAKVDAQATAKALESAEGSVAKAEAAANRAVDAAIAADDSAVEASRSALSAGDSAEAARLSADAAANSADNASTSARSAADAASAASGSASAAEQSATDASSAKVAAQTAKAEAATSASNAATSASNAESSATAAEKSASDAAASVGAINVIAPKIVRNSAIALGVDSIAFGNISSALAEYGIAIGTNAQVGSDSSSGVSLGANTSATALHSVAIGYGSVSNKQDVVSFGNDNLNREIIHVSEPTAPTSASTKKYTDDNDAKTLNEAKKYADANTSNALVGNVSGKLLHVEDAWPSKPVSLTIEGAYKQDGTPSPENPVPITVVENPVLRATGKNLFDGELSKDLGNSVNPIYLSKGTYTISLLSNVEWWTDAANGKNVYIHNADNVYIARATFINPAVGKRSEATFTLDEDAIIKIYSHGAWENDAVSDMQIEQGAVATDYAPYTSQSLPITLPAEHPYIAKLPDGTCDEIVIDKDGNASLIARVGKVQVGEQTISVYSTNTTPYALFNLTTMSGVANALACNTHKQVQYSEVSGTIYCPNGSDIVIRDSRFTSLEAAKEALADTVLYYYITAPITYALGKLDIPSLPETISNVWTDAELTTNMSMTYKRDINIAFDNLTQAVVAAAAGE